MAKYDEDTPLVAGGWLPAAERIGNDRARRAPKKKVVRTTTFDFGNTPYTIQDFRDFVEETADLAEDARVRVTYTNSQYDGTTFKVEISE